MEEIRVLCDDGSIVGPFTAEEMKRFEKARKSQPKERPWADFFSEYFYEELDGRTAKKIWSVI